jgi:hypothetical protein
VPITHTNAKDQTFALYQGATKTGKPKGFVANFAQEVMQGQLPPSVGSLGGQRVELFGRSEALVSLLDH